HAEGIEVSGYKVIAPNDARPCFALVDVERADFMNVKADRTVNTPVFILDDVKDFSITKCLSLPDTRIAEAKHRELEKRVWRRNSGIRRSKGLRHLLRPQSLHN